jgi:hypothetical protein
MSLSPRYAVCVLDDDADMRRLSQGALSREVVEEGLADDEDIYRLHRRSMLPISGFGLSALGAMLPDGGTFISE